MVKYWLVLVMLVAVVGFVTGCIVPPDQARRMNAEESKPVSNKSLQSVAPTGSCSGIELMGVYATDDVVGVRYFAAKVRNRTNITKVVTVGFNPKSSPSVRRQVGSTSRELKGATEIAHVKPGDIATINLDFSDRAPENVRIVSCE